LDFGLWPGTIAAQWAAGAATPRHDWWAAGGKPMLIIQGLEDRFSPPENGHVTRAELGERVRVVDLPDAGHGLIVEQPEKIAAAIDEWVRTPKSLSASPT
jgi:pimeloyl-ACP methyl ester carboxylesterase